MKPGIGSSEQELDDLRQLVVDIRRDLEAIIETDGRDKGVIYLSTDSPTKYDPELKCNVYLHDNFSPLGDALIKIYDKVRYL